jgi:hypothetical protein
LKRVELKLKMKKSFWPQIDRQIEKVNLVIQQFLQNYITMDKRN